MDNTFKFEENGEEYQIVKILNPKNIIYDYIIYTNNNNDFYASRYELVNNEIRLNPIEEEYEWDYIDKEMEV